MSDFATDRASLAAWCVDFVAEMLDVSPNEINANVTFSRIGFDSAMSVQLTVALEDHLGVTLSPDVLAQHPTIASLVTYLSGLQSSSAS